MSAMSGCDTDSDTGSEQQIEYVATPAYGKSSYETEQWSTTLKNGNNAAIEITTFFHYGEFSLYLTDAEKDEVLALDEVVLTDWNCEFICNNDGFCKRVEIPNKHQYTTEELEEISRSVHMCNKTDHGPDSMIHECDEDAETDIDEGCFYDETLEKNGWCLDETIYGFQCKCDLEKVGDSEEETDENEEQCVADMV